MKSKYGISLLVVVLILVWSVSAVGDDDLWQRIIAPTGLLITGLGIGTIWTLEIISQKNVSLEGGFFEARDRSMNQILWPHWIAEYGTAVALVVSAIGLYTNEDWARPLTLVSSGLLAYTSINSLSWVLSEEGRMYYAIPMLFGLTSAGIGIGAVF